MVLVLGEDMVALGYSVREHGSEGAPAPCLPTCAQETAGLNNGGGGELVEEGKEELPKVDDVDAEDDGFVMSNEQVDEFFRVTTEKLLSLEEREEIKKKASLDGDEDDGCWDGGAFALVGCGTEPPREGFLLLSSSSWSSSSSLLLLPVAVVCFRFYSVDEKIRKLHRLLTKCE